MTAEPSPVAALVDTGLIVGLPLFLGVGLGSTFGAIAVLVALVLYLVTVPAIALGVHKLRSDR